MTDHELLELAAKAAGMHLTRAGYIVDGDEKNPIYSHPDYAWNPLIDDGDALRLAVRLHICTLFPMRGNTYKKCGAGQVGSERPAVMEPHDPDPLAATRRAIVRAAAEIGRSMK